MPITISICCSCGVRRICQRYNIRQVRAVEVAAGKPKCGAIPNGYLYVIGRREDTEARVRVAPLSSPTEIELFPNSGLQLLLSLAFSLLSLFLIVTWIVKNKV